VVLRNTLILICRASLERAHDCAITDAFQFGDEGPLRYAAVSQIRFTERLFRLTVLV